MRRGSMLLLLFFMNFPLPANAADPVQESSCYGGQVTTSVNWATDSPGHPYNIEHVYRGVARMLTWNNDASILEWRFYRQQLFDASFYAEPPNPAKWGKCVGGVCGGPNEDRQLCWSLEPFTSADTSGGETCTSTIDEQGIAVQRDQTVYAMSINRDPDPTEYCQIQFKTLATGEALDSGPPGTGTTEVWEFAGVPDTPDIVPDEPIVDAPNFSPSGIAVPFIPHFLLVSLTVMLAALGVRRVRRRNAA